jgi:two-component system phosphate regulon response regulator PhoB
MAVNPKTVLIIEDEPEAAELFAEMMRVSGFQVLKSYSSGLAVNSISQEKPDLVILDLMMPEISGLDILRNMRSRAELAKIPAVVVSAKGLPSDVREGLEAGASVYLTKPVGFAELKNAVERALRDS